MAGALYVMRAPHGKHRTSTRWDDAGAPGARGVNGPRAEVEAAGFGHLDLLIDDTSSHLPGAQVIGQLDGVWVTFLRDERGVVGERKSVEHPDERSAVTEFESPLRNVARLKELNRIREENELAFREIRRKGDSPHVATTAEGSRG